jgi:outer membrane protein TolC
LINGSPEVLNQASNAGSLKELMARPVKWLGTVCLTTSILFVCLTASAQPSSASLPVFIPSKSYDLGSLVELGMATNPATRAAFFRARAASSKIGEEKAAYLPVVNAAFEGGLDRWYTPATAAPDIFHRRQATTILSLEYLLLDFGRRTADVARAVALCEAAGLVYERKIQEVVFSIQSRYFAHESALWQERAASAMRDFARTAFETIRLESQTGLAARPDYLQAQKNLLDAEYKVEKARALARNTLGELCVASGLQADTPLKLSESDLPPDSGVLRQTASRLVEAALASRPDLAARAAEVRASSKSVRRAQADFLPEVRLEGNYGYSAFQYDSQTGKAKNSNADGINGYGLPEFFASIPDFGSVEARRTLGHGCVGNAPTCL